ncbi:MAG: hypothetical protein WBG65_00435 [Sulfurimonadaceae bacterium]
MLKQISILTVTVFLLTGCAAATVSMANGIKKDAKTELVCINQTKVGQDMTIYYDQKSDSATDTHGFVYSVVYKYDKSMDFTVTRKGFGFSWGYPMKLDKDGVLIRGKHTLHCKVNEDYVYVAPVEKKVKKDVFGNEI